MILLFTASKSLSMTNAAPLLAADQRSAMLIPSESVSSEVEARGKARQLVP
jgi:hypothetical protein